MNKTTWYKKTWVKVVGAIFLFFYVSNLIKNKNGFGGYAVEKQNVIMNANFQPLEIYEIK
jgi:hypothetical protein